MTIISGPSGPGFVQLQQKVRYSMQISDSTLSLSSAGYSLTDDRQVGSIQLDNLPAASTGLSGGLNTGGAATVRISAEAQKIYMSSRKTDLSSFSVVGGADDSGGGTQALGTREASSSDAWGAESLASETTTTQRSGGLPAGWNVQMSSTSYSYENEKVGLYAGGSVTTGDGRQISFSISLGMSREYASVEKTTVGVSVAASPVTTDPLVINFKGGLPGLSDAKFSFDIDSDGDTEMVSAAASGSGFLALDKNGDGAINNGSELFGPGTGSGYSELSAYDGDHNGWIDENDDIFSRLSIWTTDETGNKKLISLKNAGIGAISLASASTPFSLTDDTNQLKGLVRGTGVILFETGRVGVMQQIDLATDETADASASDSGSSGATDLTAAASERLKNIGNLAATATWLANRSSELRNSLRENLENMRRRQGSDDEDIDSIAGMLRRFRESFAKISEDLKGDEKTSRKTADA
jgi:hypothetical protein